MKIHIEIEVPRWVQNVALVVLPAGLLVTATAVYADVPNIFKDGDTLSAQKLNDDFAALDTRLATIENSLVSSPTPGGVKLFTATLTPNTGSSNCTLSQDGAWIAGAVHSGVGACQLVFAGGTFQSAPVCVASSQFFVATIGGLSATGAIAIAADTNGAGIDNKGILLMCVGH